MAQVLTSVIETGFGLLGLRLQRQRPYRDPVQHLCLKIPEFGVATVLDVGANEGQFGSRLREAGYAGKIISFEPLARCREVLSKTARNDSGWYVAERAALGAKDDTVIMNVSENLVSSSMLPIAEKTVSVHAPARYVATEEVPLRRLDAMRDPTWKAPFALKIDTQGFELEVLKGATAMLPDVPVVLLEMSLVTIYEGGAGFAELYAWMEQAGYRCIGITEGLSDVQRNEQLQADAVFVRN
jgi:FkbM family methyltransferase